MTPILLLPVIVSDLIGFVDQSNDSTEFVRLIGRDHSSKMKGTSSSEISSTDGWKAIILPGFPSLNGFDEDI